MFKPKFFLVLLFLSALFFGLCGFNKTQEATTIYIEKYSDIAIREMQRSGIPASITLAQAIIESAWGKGELAVSSNNFFGIKCKEHWQGPTFYIEDDDLDRNGKLIKSCFRAYEDVEQSFMDHSDFLVEGQRYQKLFTYGMTDYVQWAKGLKAAGYATDPKYADKLIRTIEKYQLYRYDEPGTPPLQIMDMSVLQQHLPQSRPMMASTDLIQSVPVHSYGKLASTVVEIPVAVAETLPTATIKMEEVVISAPVAVTNEIATTTVLTATNVEAPPAMTLPDDYVRNSGNELNLGGNTTTTNFTGPVEAEVAETIQPIEVATVVVPEEYTTQDPPVKEQPLPVVKPVTVVAHEMEIIQPTQRVAKEKVMPYSKRVKSGGSILLTRRPASSSKMRYD